MNWDRFNSAPREGKVHRFINRSLPWLPWRWKAIANVVRRLGYLSKPIDLQKLDEVLAVYADRRRSDVDVTVGHDDSFVAAVNTTELL
jgi:hypothetical protein